MKIHVYEKAFLTLGAALLLMCLFALGYTSLVMGIHLTGRSGEVDPEKLATTAPFDNPGVHQRGPDEYEVVMIGKIWSFVPSEVTVPVNANIKFTATSADVIHGMHIDGTRLNLMLIPGQVTQNEYRFSEPGRYMIVCHEYCGAGHHTMFGTIVVE